VGQARVRRAGAVRSAHAGRVRGGAELLDRFGKRDAFRNAFRDFCVAEVAAMTADDVDRLVEDASIIRNRAKIEATVDNARAS